MRETKQADSGVPDVSAHRNLSPEEEKALEAGKARWLPRVFQSYGTPIPELMASPLKTGLIFGLPAGIIGAGLGSAIGGAATGKNNSGMGALIGGLGAGGLAAIAAGMDREAKNEGLEELMRRMPEGAAKRDLLADPQYQADFLGWDNNKIVATARARYYRPTERFSKRTSDMADARARYNERHKSSSVNDVNKDVSMSQRENEKQSMFGLGVPVGAMAGLATSQKGKRLRAMGRGALKGLGSDFGSAPGALLGAGLGGGLGMLVGGPAGLAAGAGLGAGVGGLGGSYLGAKTVGEVLGPYNAETDEAKLERLLAARANKNKPQQSAEPAEKSDDEERADPETRKAAQAILDSKTLTLAEKMAAYKTLLLKQADEPIPLPNIPVDETAIPPLMPAPMPGPRSTAGQRVVTPPAGMGMGGDSAPSAPMNVNVPPPSLLTSGGSAPAGAPRSAPSAPAGNQPSTLEVLKHLVGVGNRRSTLYDETAKRLGQVNEGRKALGGAIGENVLYPAAKGISGAASAAGSGISSAAGAVNKARIGAGNWLGENILYPAAKGLYNAPGALKDFGKWLKPDAPPPPGLLEQLKPYAPYAAVGGAGLGALALADYLSRGKKKKRRPAQAQEDEEYDMPKAANLNWYQLARERQKRSNALIPYVAPAAKAIAAVAPQVVKIPGAASSASKLPSWLLPAAGTAGGAGGIYGLSKLLGGKDPSILEQIMKSKYTPYAAAGLGTAGLLGGAAYMGSRAGKSDAKKKKPAAEKKADLMSAGMGGAMGAGLGGAAGALYGAIAPGHEMDPETGRRRRRSRLMAALRGLAGGAAAGGLGGAAIGHFMPGVPHGAMDAVGMGKQLELPMPSPAENMQANVAKLSPAQQKIHAMIMQRNKAKAPATPDPIELAKSQANMQAMGEEPGSDPLLGPNAAMQNQMAQQ